MSESHVRRVKETSDMLAVEASASIPAGGSGTIDIKVPVGEVWEITKTNSLDSSNAGTADQTAHFRLFGRKLVR